MGKISFEVSQPNNFWHQKTTHVVGGYNRLNVRLADQGSQSRVSLCNLLLPEKLQPLAVKILLDYDFCDERP